MMNDHTPCVLGCYDPRTEQPRHATPGLYACPPCADRLAGQLAELERYAERLDDPLELMPARTGERGAPGYGSRSPALDHLIAHRDVRTVPDDTMPAPALAILEQWARTIREETTLDTPPDRMRATVPAGRATLTRELATIRFHWHYVLGAEWLPEFADEVRGVLDALRTAARARPPVLRLGPCPMPVPYEVTDQHGRLLRVECGAPLRVRPGDESIRCPGCGTEWPRHRWHELGDEWVDFATLAEQLGVPVGTLHYWRHVDEWRTAGTRSRRLVSRVDALTSYARRRGNKPAA